MKYFTIYWLHGCRCVIKGETVQDAYVKKGYGGDPSLTIDWWEEGVTETHYWDQTQKKWVKYEPLVIKTSDLSNLSDACLKDIFKSHHGIDVVFPDNDKLVLQMNIGHYLGLGYVRHIELWYGEYHNYPYTEECSSNHHYMVTQVEHFDASSPEKAITALRARLTNPSKATNMGVRLEEIKPMFPKEEVCGF